LGRASTVDSTPSFSIDICSCNASVEFGTVSMDQEMEMCVRRASEGDQKKTTEAGQDMERSMSAAAGDGKPRTMLQMVAIITALFVRTLETSHRALYSFQTCNIAAVVVVRGSSRRNHCIYSRTYDLRRPELGCWLHMDRRCISSRKCSIWTDLGQAV
jgi:hypothetical protein